MTSPSKVEGGTICRRDGTGWDVKILGPFGKFLSCCYAVTAGASAVCAGIMPYLYACKRAQILRNPVFVRINHSTIVKISELSGFQTFISDGFISSRKCPILMADPALNSLDSELFNALFDVVSEAKTARESCEKEQ